MTNQKTIKKIQKIQQSRRLLKLLTGLDKETRECEKSLAKQLRRFFTKLQKKLINEYLDTSDEYLKLFEMQVPILINKEWDLYEKVLGRYNNKAASIGLLYNKLLTDYSFTYAREKRIAQKSEDYLEIRKSYI